jgi:preprotein translocase subunit SecD
LSNEKGAVLTGSDVESMNTSVDKASNLLSIDIRFRKESVGTWADVTRRNMDQAIAIVLDKEVLSAPIVRSVIEGGKASITGNFTSTEARYIVAMGNNGELPVSFQVVK